MRRPTFIAAILLFAWVALSAGIAPALVDPGGGSEGSPELEAADQKVMDEIRKEIEAIPEASREIAGVEILDQSISRFALASTQQRVLVSIGELTAKLGQTDKSIDAFKRGLALAADPLIRDYLTCGDAATGQEGLDGDCVSEVRTIGNLVQCESNANYMALMMWATGFVGCMFTCGAIPASGPGVPFAILKCLACIASFSSAPAMRPCQFIYCTSGGRGKDIPGNVATGLSGKPCVGGQDAPAI